MIPKMILAYTNEHEQNAEKKCNLLFSLKLPGANVQIRWLCDVSLVTWKRCLVLLACPFRCFAFMFCFVAENCLLDGFLVCLSLKTRTLHTHKSNCDRYFCVSGWRMCFFRHKAKQQLNQRTLMSSVC